MLNVKMSNRNRCLASNGLSPNASKTFHNSHGAGQVCNKIIFACLDECSSKNTPLIIIWHKAAPLIGPSSASLTFTPFSAAARMQYLLNPLHQLFNLLLNIVRSIIWKNKGSRCKGITITNNLPFLLHTVQLSKY